MKRIIPALDVSNIEDLDRLAAQLAPHSAYLKLGLEVITGGFLDEALEVIREYGGKAFVDIKLHDIPNTVGRAAKNLSLLSGVDMFNMHASAGPAAMRAAAENAGDCNVLAVTILTSLDEEECNHVYGGPVKAKVLEFARDAALAHLAGIICSPQDLAPLRKHPELANLWLVTPGVRPEWADANDQKRVMTPAEAVKAGANFVVIGRPITNPPKTIGSPEDAILRIQAEIDAVEAAVGPVPA